MNYKTIPQTVFLGVSKDDSKVYICATGEGIRFTDVLDISTDNASDVLYEWLTRYPREHNYKVVTAGIAELEGADVLGERLWLELDIVPVMDAVVSEEPRERAELLAQQIAQSYVKKQNLDVYEVKKTTGNEVLPNFLTTFAAYEKVYPAEDIALLLREINRFKEKKGKLMFINATVQGGGVALMRHAMIRLFKLVGLDARWFVLKPDLAVFDITKKKFHNILQGVAPADVVLGDDDKALFNAWSRENAEILRGPIEEASVIVIDDWQPSGLIEYIKQWNPDAKILFRSHIQVDTSKFVPDSPQLVTWDFVWKNRIELADVFISHPIPEFVPNIVPLEKVVLMPAATDKLDGLNKPLSDEQLDYYLDLFNTILEGDGQTALDRARPYIVQIARFDPSKGIPDVLESYHALREMCKQSGVPAERIPQLVIAGHGSVDDPEGIPILEQTRMTLSLEGYKEYAMDVKTARLPHNDQVLDALLRGSRVALQLSHKEGLEVKISEALHKGKPVVINRAGGMPLQVVKDQNSFVMEVGATDAVAEALNKLFNDDSLYETMSRNAETMVKEDFFTVRNVINWIFLANEVLEHGKLEGNGANVKDLISQSIGVTETV